MDDAVYRELIVRFELVQQQVLDLRDVSSRNQEALLTRLFAIEDRVRHLEIGDAVRRIEGVEERIEKQENRLQQSEIDASSEKTKLTWIVAIIAAVGAALGGVAEKLIGKLIGS